MTEFSHEQILTGAKAMILLGDEHRKAKRGLPSRLQESQACLEAALAGHVLIPRSEIEEALNSWEALLPYKSEYLVEKHCDREEIAEFRAKYLSEPKP